ncbi:hypothetical protein D3C73_1225250 [compost metagenome]
MTHGKGDAITNPATKRTNKRVGEEHREDQRAHRDDHQIQVIRDETFQARFNQSQRQTCQQSRNNLRLVADFFDRKQAEVPHFRHLLAQQIRVHQLR